MSEHKYFPPSVYVSFSELKDGETFTFRYGDREHRFTDHIYMRMPAMIPALIRRIRNSLLQLRTRRTISSIS